MKISTFPPVHIALGLAVLCLCGCKKAPVPSPSEPRLIDSLSYLQCPNSTLLTSNEIGTAVFVADDKEGWLKAVFSEEGRSNLTEVISRDGEIIRIGVHDARFSHCLAANSLSLDFLSGLEAYEIAGKRIRVLLQTAQLILVESRDSMQSIHKKQKKGCYVSWICAFKGTSTWLTTNRPVIVGAFVTSRGVVDLGYIEADSAALDTWPELTVKDVRTDSNSFDVPNNVEDLVLCQIDSGRGLVPVWWTPQRVLNAVSGDRYEFLEKTADHNGFVRSIHYFTESGTRKMDEFEKLISQRYCLWNGKPR
jgi:hypothetical protein